MAGLLPAIVERFSNQYPRVRLRVELVQTALLQFQKLRERKIDLLIGRIPQTTADDLNSEMLFAKPFLIVAGNNGKWARREGLKLADLVAEPWALPPYDSIPGQLILQIFQAARLQLPRPTIVTLSGQLTVTLVAGGGFVGMLPASVAKFNIKRAGLKLLPIKLPTVHVAASIVTVKNRTPARQQGYSSTASVTGNLRSKLSEAKAIRRLFAVDFRFWPKVAIAAIHPLRKPSRDSAVDEVP